ncbi:hypothetical protein BDW75DRAFT_63723 [Aspergillus navahoensis]
MNTTIRWTGQLIARPCPNARGLQSMGCRPRSETQCAQFSSASSDQFEIEAKPPLPSAVKKLKRLYGGVFCLDFLLGFHGRRTRSLVDLLPGLINVCLCRGLRETCEIEQRTCWRQVPSSQIGHEMVHVIFKLGISATVLDLVDPRSWKDFCALAWLLRVHASDRCPS